MGKHRLDCGDNFINRELSWLEFNRRVLCEAEETSGNLLLDRLRFLAITASNLDEFFMVRIAALRDQVHVDYSGRDISGMTPGDQLKEIDLRVRAFREDQSRLWQDSLAPELAREGIVVLGYEELIGKKSGKENSRGEDRLSRKDRDFLDTYFAREVFPVLTPMAVDSSRPFPLIHNKTLHIGALVRARDKKKKKYDVATVPVPSVLPRIIRIPGDKGASPARFVLLEDLIQANLPNLFLNHEILCSAPYRVMRSADLAIAEEEAPDLLLEIEKQLKKRERGEVIMMEYFSTMDPQLKKALKKKLKVKNRQMYGTSSPLDLTFLEGLAGIKGFRHLKGQVPVPQVNPRLVAGQDIFAQIRKRDVLLHHPYESFDPVTDLIRQAAEDDKVLAIKQTLYRVSGNSPIIDALELAAREGKQVLVVVELKARFDEEKNIKWARRLEQAGVHVIYGLVGLKIHCKIALIVRKESDGIRRYVHLGTGNYNDKTARQYTDLGMFTCREEVGQDATALFNMLSGYSTPASWNRMIVAPLHMKEDLLERIHEEIAHARAGRPSGIIAKCNALCDKDIILALYEASCAGVRIDLIVRGICCLRPGVPGLSDHIRVRSIVGTFLEHARIYAFANGGNPVVWSGSADLMPRNLERRVEVLFPIEKRSLKEKALHILDVELADREKAWFLKGDGSYVREGTPENRKEQAGSRSGPAGAQRVFTHEAEDTLRQSSADKAAGNRWTKKSEVNLG